MNLYALDQVSQVQIGFGAVRFGQAIPAGRPGRKSLKPAMCSGTLNEGHDGNETCAVSIRVPIANASQIAEQTGVGYQPVLNRAIRDLMKKPGNTTGVAK